MKRRNKTLWYVRQQQCAYPAKSHPGHTILTIIDLGTKDNNKKPVVIPAITTLAIDQLKATPATLLTTIQSQGS